MQITTPELRRRDHLKRLGPYWLLLISILASCWIYFGEDYRAGQLLMSREWKSHAFSRIEETVYKDVEGLTTTEQHSNMVFLPNHNYSRVTEIVLNNVEGTGKVTISISEAGSWEVSGGYLKLKPTEIKDVTTGDKAEFADSDLKLVRTFYRLGAERVRRIDVLSSNAMLLTSLNHGSLVLFSK